jgi:hypothetical protein
MHYACHCTETDLFKKLPELEPDREPDPAVKFPDPTGCNMTTGLFLQHDDRPLSAT